MRVESIDDAVGLARCIDESGAANEVMIALVADVSVGDTLLVHAATALARLDRNGSRSA